MTERGALAGKRGAGKRLVRKARTLASMPPLAKAWLVPAWFGLGLADLLIIMLPLRRIVPLLGRSSSAIVSPAATPDQQRRGEAIGQAVRTAARYAPFRSDCYPQAIVAALICRVLRIPCAVFFGIAREEAVEGCRWDKAHAWVTSGSVVLTGGDYSATRYGVVACFVQTLTRGRGR